MSNKKDHALYDSKKYSSYNPVCLVEFFELSQTYNAVQKKLLYSKEVEIDRAVIYNKEEYYAVELSKKEFDLYSLIYQSDIRQKFDTVQTQITIFPNSRDRNFSIIISDIIFLYKIYLEPMVIVNAYFGPQHIYMHSDTDQEVDTELIGKYLERNVLNIEERQFVSEMQVKQYEAVQVVEEKPKHLFSNLFAKKKDDDEEKNENKFNLSIMEQKIFNMNALKIVNGSANPEKELDNLIGLENVKREIKKLKAKLEYQKKREARGIKDNTVTNLHMCFLGSPGTGKTTVARIMTGLLYNLGYLKENKCIEIGANELKGGYVGQTAIKTKAIMRNAKNKILFIDEAYSLFDKSGSGYGKEAIDVIIKEMEDNKNDLIVIFAGYHDEMEKFLKMNDGLKSRINRYIDFENYTTVEMGKIFTSFLRKKKLYINQDALEKSLLLFKNAGLKDRFSNGRFARNLLEKVEEEHAYNVRNSTDSQRRDTITTEDISTDIIRELLTQSM